MAADELSLTQDRGLVCALTVQHLAARRNKRCLLAYLHNRVGGIKERWWDAGGGLAYLLSPAASAIGSGTSSAQGAGAAGQERSGAGGTTNNSAAESLEGEAPDLRSALSPQELDFLRGYNALMLDYKSDFLDVLDLTAGIDRPPGELMVDVRVVRDAGEVILEGGERVEFKRGERFRLVRGQVERLIVQGYLEEI